MQQVTKQAFFQRRFMLYAKMTLNELVLNHSTTFIMNIMNYSEVYESKLDVHFYRGIVKTGFTFYYCEQKSIHSCDVHG